MMAGKKSGLGRGLDALFPEKTVQSKPKTVKTVKEEKKVAVDTKKSSQQETSNGERMMKISMIEPNREQPRKKFDEDALQELSESIKQYGTLSVQRGRLKSSGIEKYLQGVFISEEIGYNKPSIEYFEKCFSKIPDFKKENTAIIGDSLSSDIQGGINAGIKTIWFHRAQDLTEDPQPKPDYEINSLKFLLEMLK